MVDSVQIDRKVKGSFIIEAETLRKVSRHLADATHGGVNCAARFNNARTIRSGDLEAILEDSSVSRFKLISLEMSAGRRIDNNFARVSFASDRLYPVGIEIEGNRQFALSLEDSAINELDSARSGWQFINPAHWKYVDMGVVTSLSIGATIGALAMATYLGGPDGEFFKSLVPYTGATAVLSYTLQKLGPVLAPPIVFNMGKGKTVHRRTQAGLSIGFGVVVLGIIVNLLSDKVKSIVGL